MADWAFDGNQLSIKNALALAYAFGFRGGQRLITAVSVMTAESARYVKAWHINRDASGEVASTDRGLWQINDKAQPGWTEDELYDPRRNTAIAFKIWKGRGNFSAWAAYNSGAHLKYVPIVTAVWLLGRWRDRIAYWRMGG